MINLALSAAFEDDPKGQFAVQAAISACFLAASSIFFLSQTGRYMGSPPTELELAATPLKSMWSIFKVSAEFIPYAFWGLLRTPGLRLRTVPSLC